MVRHDSRVHFTAFSPSLMYCSAVPRWLWKAATRPGSPPSFRPKLPHLGDQTFKGAFLRSGLGCGGNRKVRGRGRRVRQRHLVLAALPRDQLRPLDGAIEGDHPLDEEVRAFYHRFGFVDLPGDPHRAMIVRMTDLEQSGFGAALANFLK